MELRESRNLILLEARSKNLTNFAQPSASFSAPPDGIFADPKRTVSGRLNRRQRELRGLRASCCQSATQPTAEQRDWIPPTSFASRPNGRYLATRVSSFKIYLRFLLRNQNKKSRRPGNECGPNGCTMRGESTHILHLKIESVYNSCADVRRSESSRLFGTFLAPHARLVCTML